MTPSSSNWKPSCPLLTNSLFVLFFTVQVAFIASYTISGLFMLQFNIMWETWGQVLYFTCLPGLCNVWYCALVWKLFENSYWRYRKYTEHWRSFNLWKAIFIYLDNTTDCREFIFVPHSHLNMYIFSRCILDKANFQKNQGYFIWLLSKMANLNK